MAVERIGEVSVSASPGIKTGGGGKSKVLKLRVPYKIVKDLGIIRSEVPTILYIDPEIDMAKKTGVFSLIYKFDVNEMRRHIIHDKINDKIKANVKKTDFNLDDVDINSNNEENDFSIDDIIEGEDGTK